MSAVGIYDLSFWSRYDAQLHFRDDGRVDVDLRRPDGLRVQCNGKDYEEAWLRAQALLRRAER